jgi:hypothetical protein
LNLFNIKRIYSFLLYLMNVLKKIENDLKIKKSYKWDSKYVNVYYQKNIDYNNIYKKLKNRLYKDDKLSIIYFSSKIKKIQKIWRKYLIFRNQNFIVFPDFIEDESLVINKPNNSLNFNKIDIQALNSL